ncbi:extracellular catalytic domain type 1 short-chain-length polyhydroxyalkanoate depolymerase [Massilia sp. SM-13]|uniref:extracellular catalytic domain type 1 short-chain-length polyhydroxyalkanoate depolymerase n=1 Tax=Pseudoduganella rhizocola TaxID=3382643 RepID=UPI0038B67622
MKFDKDTVAGIQLAARKIMAEGPLEATKAIQRALAGAVDEAPAPPMKDLNPPPPGSRKVRKPPFSMPGVELPGGLMPEPARRKPPRTPAAPLPAGARFLAAAYRGAEGSRSYKLYVPASYQGQAMPLVVMLHGCTQDPDDFAAGTRMNQLAERDGFLVLYPAQSRKANHSLCWNWFQPDALQTGRGEAAIIAGMVASVMDDYAVQADHISIAGLSAGGAMALAVATLHPETFRCVGVHSGLPFGAAHDLPSALQAMQSGSATGTRPLTLPRLIVFHGDKDKTVHPANSAHILDSRTASEPHAKAEITKGKAQGGRRYTCTTHRRLNGEVFAEQWEIHGAGHAWAGGNPQGSFTDVTGPDASSEMLRFFGIAAAG